jgi:hypothetical protein
MFLETVEAISIALDERGIADPALKLTLRGLVEAGAEHFEPEVVEAARRALEQSG